MFPEEVKTKGLNSSPVAMLLSQRTETGSALSGVEAGRVSKRQQES